MELLNCVCAHVHALARTRVHACQRVCVEVRGEPRVAFLPSTLYETDLLCFSIVYTRVAGAQVFREFLVFASHVPLGGLELEMFTLCLDCPWILRIPTQAYMCLQKVLLPTEPLPTLDFILFLSFTASEKTHQP